MNAQREALRLHGLSERQIDDIAKNHKLLRDLQIVAPGRDSHGDEEFKLSGTEVTPVSLSGFQERPKAAKALQQTSKLRTIQRILQTLRTCR